MVTATKGKKVCFTCLNSAERFINVMAVSPEEADRKTNFSSGLIIEGTARAIKTRRVKENGSLDVIFADKYLTEGAVCTFTVADPVLIENATYQGMVEIGEYPCLAFQKNNVSFWVLADGLVYFNQIGDTKF